MKILKMLLALAVLGGLGGLGFLYSGLYPMGADVPHNRLTYWALETLRERSIAERIKDIEVPPLDDSNLLLAGGADYNDMCAGCHLKPGKTESDISLGLYPPPPNLASSASEHGHSHGDGDAGDAHGDAKTSAARQFWIIKHGIKASGMAAFGRTHDDPRIWAMVAFLQKLPTLTPVQYQILTAREPGEDEHGDHMSREGMEKESVQKPASSDSGSPPHLRSDNGPEFVSRAVLKWLMHATIDTAHIDPGKPWRNGSNERFNGKFRDECLSMEWFRNRIDAKLPIEQFRRQYNEVRPHSGLGQLTPVEFKQKLSATTNPEQAIS